MFEEYRRIGFDLSIKRAERKGRVLYVKEGEYEFGKGFLPGYARVEENSGFGLRLDKEDHAMLLGMMCCDDVMIQFHGCCELLLRGLYFS